MVENFITQILQFRGLEYFSLKIPQSSISVIFSNIIIISIYQNDFALMSHTRILCFLVKDCKYFYICFASKSFGRTISIQKYKYKMKG